MPEQRAKSKHIKLLLSIAAVVALGSLLYSSFKEEEDTPIVDATIPIPEGQTGPLPDFASFDNVVEKKKAFFGYLLPEIEKQNALVLQERAYIMQLNEKAELSDNELAKLAKLVKKYKVDEQLTNQEKLTALLRRVDVIPAELVLVQAANESAWGTSRFARKGYNFFGMWCFSEGCGFVPKQRDGGAVHEVAKFKDLSHAVAAYLRNLNRHYAYKELRQIRQNLRNQNKAITAEKLVHGLSSYSERGQDYIDELLDMISFNKKYMQV